MVCDVGDGWTVATTTLMHERRGADGLRSWATPSDAKGRIYEEERAEIATDDGALQVVSAARRPGRPRDVERAKETGKINDPVIRQEIAKLLIMSKSAEWTARRARAAQEQGRPQGPEGSLGKLVASHVARQAARVHTYLTGADALLSGEDSPMNGVIAEILISVPASSIAGGTDEIQRNIISERVLKMPQRAQRRHQQALQGRAAQHRVVVVSLSAYSAWCYNTRATTLIPHASFQDQTLCPIRSQGKHRRFRSA